MDTQLQFGLQSMPHGGQVRRHRLSHRGQVDQRLPQGREAACLSVADRLLCTEQGGHAPIRGILPPKSSPATPTPDARTYGSTTLNLSLASVGSVLPAGSVARTFRVCLPGLTWKVLRVAQALNFLLSSLHWKVEPASSESNL